MYFSLLIVIGIFSNVRAQSVVPVLPISTNTYTVELENSDTRAINPNYRLPNDTYPEHYDIKLSTNVHIGERPFQGEVIIDIVVAKATNNIVLHARQLNISQVTLRNPLTGSSELLTSKYESEREFLTLTRKSNKKLLADTKWKLAIIYNGELRADNKGFYMSSYEDDEGKDRYMATTQFESTDARHAFPCYDEPDKRANFTITINHVPNYTVVSNMPVNEALSSPGKTVFLTTDRIPTYIVAFIVSDLKNSSGLLNDLPQHIYSRYNSLHAHEWAMVSGLLITERLSKYYGVKFMLPKMDHAAIPDFAAGGMENWGLATYREEYLLYDESSSTVFTQTSVANILAHEICHQWFGDYVTLKWWTYLWLKEGFATLFSFKALDDAYPEWGVWQEFHADTYQTALNSDANNPSRPMTHYVQTPQEIASLYDAVSYSKAGAVLHMWNNAFTDRVFQRGLHNYLTTNQYNAAVEEQLFDALQIAAKEENYQLPATITEMFSSWSRQGGYPILTVARNYSDGTFTVEQKAFCNDENVQSNKTWYVPINYAVASIPDFHDTEASHYLLNVNQIKINAGIGKKDWLVLNKQSAFYYRIKYDAQNYNLITESLIQKPHRIHPRNRAQLMHDAFALSTSNRLDHGILLKMLTYLKKEDQYAPWLTANQIFNAFNRYLRADVAHTGLMYFIAEQIGPIYEKLGINDIPGEQHYQKYTRNIAINLACLARIPDCLQETSSKLMHLISDNERIEPNLEAPIYCNGLKYSSGSEFAFVYKKLMDSTDQALRRLLISALGCSENENHLMKFISSSIDETNELRTQERYTLLKPVYSRSEVGLLTCIDFLNKNWKAYGNLTSDFGGSNPLNNDIIDMAYYVVSQEQEEKFMVLVDKVKNSEFASSNLEKSVKQKISTNFEWLDKNRKPLASWFLHYQGSAGNIAASAVLVTSGVMLAAIRLF